MSPNDVGLGPGSLPGAPLPSKSRVNKAGKRLRAVMRNASPLDPELFSEDLAVVEAHRAAHAQPMTTANVALRRRCSRQRLDARITQRLKRIATILDKLTREPSLALGNMHDLGGVRVVVRSMGEMSDLRDWLVSNHPDAEVYDYAAHPRSSGYRAIHVVAEWGDKTRKPVEIQLRTTVMNAWADMVEEASMALGVNYKRDFDSLFNDWARAASAMMAAGELGQQVPDEMREQYTWASRALFGSPARLERGGTHES